MRQLIIGLTALAAGACLSARVSFPDECPPRASRFWHAFDSAAVVTLPGDYVLILVSQWEDLKGSSARGPMTLVVSDTLHRYYERGIGGQWYRTGDRPVLGWADIDLSLVEAASSANPSSRDPDRPGVVVHADGQLELGVWRGLDGYTTDLRITHVSPTGFRGTWDTEWGLAYVERNGQRVADPHGYFCALRSSVTADTSTSRPGA